MSPLPRPPARLPVLVLAVVTAAVGLLGAGVAVASPGAGDPLAASGTRAVSYGGVTVRVPAAWPVVDLDSRPGTCVRLDRPTVYLGSASAQQDCPAHLVGRTDTVWLMPMTTAERQAASAAPQKAVGALPGTVGAPAADSSRRVGFAGRGVTLQTTWGRDPARVDAVVASATATTGGKAGDGLSGPATSTAPSTTPAAPATRPTAVPAATGRVVTGMTFDTCAAPSLSTMQTWRTASPYAAMGIYIGGALRACGDGNLSASWVTSVSSQGWGLMPLYVGLQAPCVSAPLRTFTAANAATTATANANDAVAMAQKFGLGPGTVIHYDLESYATGDASCSSAVTTFVTAWTRQLHARGYLAGVYGNVGSLMTDMSRQVAAGSSSFTAPDQVWYALWDGLQTTSAGSGYPAFPDAYWAGHRRHHQYRGDFTETWGGVSLNIDANWTDAAVAGRPTQTAYGAGILGPGSAGFRLTGSTTYWKPLPGQGLKGMAYSTGTAQSTTEYNGATWSTAGSGTFAVDAYIPAVDSTGIAHYTVSDATGSHVVALDQAPAKGWRRIGTFTGVSGRTMTIHLGDNDTKAARLAADAIRFTRVGAPPGAPSAVTATPASGAATVGWAPAAANGATITSYVVTASPGGRTATVAGTAGSATVSGLANGTAYRFSVKAVNAAGTGPASAASNLVIPVAAGRVVMTTPTPIIDSRNGTAVYPAYRQPLAPGRSVTFTVAGIAGSPVPRGATRALLQVTAVSPSATGAVVSGGSTVVALAAGRTSTNAFDAKLNPVNGTVMLTNTSSAPVSLQAAVTAYTLPGTTGALWAGIPGGTRVMDTQTGAAANTRATALRAHESVTVRVAGGSGTGVPAGAGAASLVLSTVGPTTPGSLVVGTGSTAPAFAFATGGTVANLVLAPLSTSGTVTLTNSSAGTVNVIVDAQGYLSTVGAQWTATVPSRVADTRVGTSANPLRTGIAPGGTVRVDVAGATGSPVPAGATSAAVNLSVVGPTASGTLGVTAWGWTARGTAMSFAAGPGNTTLALVPLAADGSIAIGNRSAGTVQVVVDVQGFAR